MPSGLPHYFIRRILTLFNIQKYINLYLLVGIAVLDFFCSSSSRVFCKGQTGRRKFIYIFVLRLFILCCWLECQLFQVSGNILTIWRVGIGLFITVSWIEELFLLNVLAFYARKIYGFPDKLIFMNHVLLCAFVSIFCVFICVCIIFYGEEQHLH